MINLVEILTLVCGLLFVVMGALAFGTIFRKAGYPSALGLLMLVPVVNIVAIVAFALLDWPIQRELAQRRLASGEKNQADASMLLTQATKLDQCGEWDKAVTLYELVANTMHGEPIARDATQLIEAVREKQAMAARADPSSSQSESSD